jgi:adhesin transport system outer membrane protein
MGSFMKYFFILFLVSVLYGEESCYTVQLFSKISSDKNRDLLLQNTYDSSCKMMEIGKSLTVRCGCFVSKEDVEKTLPTYKKEYKNAYIMRTYKSRFAKGIQGIKTNTLIIEKSNMKIQEKEEIPSVKFKEASFNINSPIGDTKMCVNSVDILLNKTYNHYPSIQASKQMINAKQAQIESAKWNYFPTPSVDISQRSGRRNMVFRLEQPLWTGGKLDAMNELALSKYDEAQSMLGENKYTLIEDFLTIMQDYIEADGLKKGFLEGKEQLEGFSRLLDRRISAGISSISDKELLNARIAQIDDDLILANSKYEVARAQIELLIGQHLQCAIGFENDLILNQKKSIEEMKETLLESHPDIKKLKAQIAIAEAEKKSTDAVIMPNISLRAEHQQGSIYDEDQTNDNLVYLNFSYTPGAGLSSISNMESAKYKVLQTKDELRTKELELFKILVKYESDYRAAANRLERIQYTIKLSEKVLESYNRLFIAGKRQWLDLVNMSREVTQNKISMASLKAIYIVSSYRLALQIGNIDFEDKGE